MACMYCAENAGFSSKDMTMEEGTSDLATSVYPEVPGDSICIYPENNNCGCSRMPIVQEFRPMLTLQEPRYLPLSTVREWKPAYEDYPEVFALDLEEQDKDDPAFDYSERFALYPEEQNRNDPFFKKRAAFHEKKRAKRGFQAAHGSKIVNGDAAIGKALIPETPGTKAPIQIIFAEGEHFDPNDTIVVGVPDDFEAFPNPSKKNKTTPHKLHGRQEIGSTIEEAISHKPANTQAGAPRKRAWRETELSYSELSDIQSDSEYSEAETPRKSVKESVQSTPSNDEPRDHRPCRSIMAATPSSSRFHKAKSKSPRK
jgi:hypothetical protein